MVRLRHNASDRHHVKQAVISMSDISTNPSLFLWYTCYSIGCCLLQLMILSTLSLYHVQCSSIKVSRIMRRRGVHDVVASKVDIMTMMWSSPFIYNAMSPKLALEMLSERWTPWLLYCLLFARADNSCSFLNNHHVAGCSFSHMNLMVSTGDNLFTNT